MPTIRILDLDARAGLGNPRTEERALYRDAIATLSGGRDLSTGPRRGESLRTLKRLTNRAAKEIRRDVKHGETQEGTLLVWLARPIRRRGERDR